MVCFRSSLRLVLVIQKDFCILLLTVVIENEITEKSSHNQPLTREQYLSQLSGPHVCVKLAILSPMNTSSSFLQMTLFSGIVK